LSKQRTLQLARAFNLPQRIATEFDPVEPIESADARE
jgi:hypothetical protein